MARRSGKQRASKKAAAVVTWATDSAESGRSDPEALRLLRRENAALRRKLLSSGAEGELIMQAVGQALVGYSAPKLPPPPKVGKRKPETEEAVLHVSDTQIGKITETYDSEIAAARLLELAHKTEQLIERHRSYANIDMLHVYLGGDMIEGELIFPGQAHLIDQSVMDQAIEAAPSAIATMLLHLSRCVPKMRVVCVRGNHGRPAAKGAGSNPKTNWDTVCYRVSQLMVMGPADSVREETAKRIEWNISERFYAINEVAGWRHLLVHGDQIRGWAGIPFYGINRKAAKWAMSLPRKLRGAGVPTDGWDALFMGHFHQYTQGFVVDRPWYVNGTTESDNEWALEELGEAGDPVQRLQFWNKDHGMVSDRPVYLKSGLEAGG